MENITLEPKIDNSVYSSYVGIRFPSSTRSYFFGVKEKDMILKIDDQVVVETMRGLEIGTVSVEQTDIDKYESELGLKPVLRIAGDIDKKINECNIRDAKYALEICKNEAERLGLKMNLISCEYTLDKSKVLFSYLADERVDFRELLRILATKLHTRIELRQIGSRDKAKMIGGLGSCGLPLCCSTFLNEFDGISIARAKNQMLAINIPKLSGHCGKLICCLKYEDDAYTDAKKQYPELGSKIKLGDVEYTVSSVNVISGMIKLDNPEDTKFMLYEDIKKQQKPQVKPEQKPFEKVQFKQQNNTQNNNQNPQQNPNKENRDQHNQNHQNRNRNRHFNNNRNRPQQNEKK